MFGHQSYSHKLLTDGQGAPLFQRLRKRGSVSGFPSPDESAYDLFSVGHAGTAISTAVGMARADQHLGRDNHVVAVVGDASIVNGLSFEGLNGAGTLKRQMLMVLNDNGMSISQPQGAFAQYIERVRVSATYEEAKRFAKRIVDELPAPVGHTIEGCVANVPRRRQARHVARPGLRGGTGIKYFGPIDGHDLPGLINTLAEIQHVKAPLLLHVKTIKGHGHDVTRQEPTKFHSPAAFRVEGCRVEINKGSGKSWTTAFADAMIKLADSDPRVMALTAAMPDGTGLSKFEEDPHPNAISTRVYARAIPRRQWPRACASRASRPFAAVYSTFTQRAASIGNLAGSRPQRSAGRLLHGPCRFRRRRRRPSTTALRLTRRSFAPLAWHRSHGSPQRRGVSLNRIASPRTFLETAAAPSATRARQCPGHQLRRLHRQKSALGGFAGVESRQEPHASRRRRRHHHRLRGGWPSRRCSRPKNCPPTASPCAWLTLGSASPSMAKCSLAPSSQDIPLVTVEDHSLQNGFGTAVLRIRRCSPHCPRSPSSAWACPTASSLTPPAKSNSPKRSALMPPGIVRTVRDAVRAESDNDRQAAIPFTWNSPRAGNNGVVAPATMCFCESRKDVVASSDHAALFPSTLPRLHSAPDAARHRSHPDPPAEDCRASRRTRAADHGSTTPPPSSTARAQKSQSSPSSPAR